MIDLTPRNYVRLTLLILGLLFIQGTLMVDIRIFGVHPDLALLLPVAVGISKGPDRGAIVGFLTGVLVDLLLPTPFGLSALVGTVVGYVVGLISGTVTKELWWLTYVVMLAASAFGVLSYALLGAIVGQPQFLDVDLPVVILVIASTNVILSVPAVKVSDWAFAIDNPTGVPRVH